MIHLLLGALLFSGVFAVLTGALWARWARTQPILARTNPRVRTMVVLWVFTAFTPMFHFSERGPLDAAEGRVSPENILQLVVMFVAGVWAISRIMATARQSAFRARVAAAFMLLPVAGLLSTIWSITPSLTFVRSAQLLATVLLALATYKDVRLHVIELEEFMRRLVRTLSMVAGALTLLGLALGSNFQGRLQFPGIHTVPSSEVAGAVLLALLLIGPTRLRLARWSFALRVGILLLLLILSYTRNVWLGLIAAAVVVVLLQPERGRVVTRYAGACIAVGALTFLPLHSDEFISLVRRGDQLRTLSTLNGRLPVWRLAASNVERHHRLVEGFGYYASRVALAETPYAMRIPNYTGLVPAVWVPEYGFFIPALATAHSSWVELLAGLGVVGVVVGIVGFTSLGIAVWFIDRRRHRWLRRLLIALFVYFLTVSLVSEFPVQPGFSYSMLVLSGALALAVRRQRREPAANADVHAAQAGERINALSGVPQS